MANRWGNNGNRDRLYFPGLQKSLQMVTAATIKRHLLFGRKVITNLDSILKSRDTTLPTQVCLVKPIVFAVVMYGCESWTIKLSAEELMLLNCGVEKTLKSPLDCKEIQPVHPKGDQPWVFFGRNDAKAETPIL